MYVTTFKHYGDVSALYRINDLNDALTLQILQFLPPRDLCSTLLSDKKFSVLSALTINNVIKRVCKEALAELNNPDTHMRALWCLSFVLKIKDIELVKLIFQKIPEEDFPLAFLELVKSGDAEIFNLFIGDSRVVAELIEAALPHAVYEGHKDIVKVLLTRAEMTEQALKEALLLQQNDVEIVKELLSNPKITTSAIEDILKNPVLMRLNKWGGFFEPAGELTPEIRELLQAKLISLKAST